MAQSQSSLAGDHTLDGSNHSGGAAQQHLYVLLEAHLPATN
jgi:hypothetical protein